VHGKTPIGEYIPASMALSLGLFLDYLCVIFFGGWLASSNPMALLSAILLGSASVLLLCLGLIGVLQRPWRDVRFFEDMIVFRSEWRFDGRQTVIPMEKVWRLYSNLKNDFPAFILVWRDEQDRCRCNLFDKQDILDFPSEVAGLKERVSVDVDSYAITSFVNDEVKNALGCEPAW